MRETLRQTWRDTTTRYDTLRVFKIDMVKGLLYQFTVYKTAAYVCIWHSQDMLWREAFNVKDLDATDLDAAVIELERQFKLAFCL
jgi:hypothetical protein